MNIFFWVLVLAGIILLWFCLSFVFKGIGGVGLKLFNDAKNEILNEEKDEHENE